MDERTEHTPRRSRRHEAGAKRAAKRKTPAARSLRPEDDGRRPIQGMAAESEALDKTPERGGDDAVDEASWESFPASDAPSY